MPPIRSKLPDGSATIAEENTNEDVSDAKVHDTPASLLRHVSLRMPSPFFPPSSNRSPFASATRDIVFRGDHAGSGRVLHIVAVASGADNNEQKSMKQ